MKDIFLSETYFLPATRPVLDGISSFHFNLLPYAQTAGSISVQVSAIGRIDTTSSTTTFAETLWVVAIRAVGWSGFFVLVVGLAVVGSKA